MEEFIVYSYQKHSESLTDSYRRYTKRFIELVGDKEVEELSLTDVVNFSEYIKKELKLSDGTRHQHLVSIRQLFKYAVNVGYPLSFKPEMIPLPRFNQKIRPACTKNEVVRLAEQKVGNSYIDILRNTTIIYFLASTGLRISEMCNLTLDNLDLKEKRAVVNSTKNYSQRIVFWDDTADYWLKCYLEESEGYRTSKFVFFGRSGAVNPRTVQRNFGKAREMARINRNITPHTMRHGFATYGLDNGIETIEMKELLGHKSITSTVRYRRFSNKSLESSYRKVFREQGRKIPEIDTMQLLVAR